MTNNINIRPAPVARHDGRDKLRAALNPLVTLTVEHPFNDQINVTLTIPDPFLVHPSALTKAFMNRQYTRTFWYANLTEVWDEKTLTKIPITIEEWVQRIGLHAQALFAQAQADPVGFFEITDALEDRVEDLS